MTVEELIEALRDLPQNAEVFTEDYAEGETTFSLAEQAIVFHGPKGSPAVLIGQREE